MQRLPQLRGDIRLTTHEIDGEKAVAVRDPLGLRNMEFTLHPDALSVLPLSGRFESF